MAGVGLRVGAQAVTPGAVRCSAWLGVAVIWSLGLLPETTRYADRQRAPNK